MDNRYDELYKKAQACGQEHILRRYPSLSEASKSKLLDQMEQLDFAALRELFHHTKQPSVTTNGISPMDAYDSEDYSEEERKQMIETGWDRLRQGKVRRLSSPEGREAAWGMKDRRGPITSGCRQESRCSICRPSACSTCPGEPAGPSPGTLWTAGESSGYGAIFPGIGVFRLCPRRTFSSSGKMFCRHWIP